MTAQADHIAPQYVIRALTGACEALPDQYLTTLQNAVGGWIEQIPATGDLTMFANEDGRARRLPYNFVASRMAHQQLFGDVVVIVDLTPDDAPAYPGSVDE